MSNTISATVTAKTGPASSLTSVVITGLVSATIEAASQIWRLKRNDGTFLDLDTSANTTSTLTYSAGVYTLTLS